MDSMIKITTGVVSRWTKPSLELPALSDSLVVALMAAVAMAVVMVMEAVVVSIDRPRSSVGFEGINEPGTRRHPLDSRGTG